MTCREIEPIVSGAGGSCRATYYSWYNKGIKDVSTAKKYLCLLTKCVSLMCILNVLQLLATQPVLDMHDDVCVCSVVILLLCVCISSICSIILN